MCDISILIVSYNTRDMTMDCLKSLFAQTRTANFEVIVVDNASCDGSASAIANAFPQVRLIAQNDNTGFACANNLAASHAKGNYLLLLNPDTVILDQAIDRLVDFARSHPEAGIWGGRTLFGDGTLNPASCWGRPTPWSVFCHAVGLSAAFRRHPWFDPESLGRWERDSVRTVDITSGCFLLIRRSLWDALDGFDPTFFMYGEEADLCLRAARMGERCMICPEAEIIHYGGGSERVMADKTVRLFRAKALLFTKHWRPTAARLGVRLLTLGAFMRMAAFRLLSLRDGAKAMNYYTWRNIWSRRRGWAP